VALTWCAVEEILLVVIAAAVLTRPGLLARPVRFRSQTWSLAGLLAAPVVVIAVTTVVMTPAWAGLGGPGRHGLRVVRLIKLVLLFELDGALVGFPAGRDGEHQVVEDVKH
jgi:hypothetical protein